ncbi:MAG: hypothetical protein ABW007_20910 [Chitinophagaceae bacterium]
MSTAVAAAEYKANVGSDFTLADAYDAAYLDVEAAGVEVEDVDLTIVNERQALNARMAEWYGIG